MGPAKREEALERSAQQELPGSLAMMALPSLRVDVSFRARVRSPGNHATGYRGFCLAEWAWVELNYRPHAYQACALTT